MNKYVLYLLGKVANMTQGGSFMAAGDKALVVLGAIFLQRQSNTQARNPHRVILVVESRFAQ